MAANKSKFGGRAMFIGAVISAIGVMALIGKAWMVSAFLIGAGSVIYSVGECFSNKKD